MHNHKIVCFDIDNTLFNPQVGLMVELRSRVLRFVMKELDLDFKNADRLIREWKQKYKSTLQGLMHETDVNIVGYLEYIHDVNLDRYLMKDDKLKKMLDEIKLDKVVISDSYSEYSKRVLDQLGVRDCFQHIYTTEDMNYCYKNDFYEFSKVVDRCKNEMNCPDADNGQLLMVENDYESLFQAKKMGMKTAYISMEGNREFHINIKTIYELKDNLCLLN